MSNLPEVWLPVIGYEGIYEVSDQGRVRSVDRIVVYCDGERHRIRGVDLSPIPRRGYLSVHLSAGNNRRKVGIHRLVCAAFLGVCPNDLEVNHKNGDKHDNRLCNLEYATASENQQHASTVLGCWIGERNGSAKLNHESVRRIRELRMIGMTYKGIASKIGVSSAAVGRVITGNAWAHVA